MFHSKSQTSAVDIFDHLKAERLQTKAATRMIGREIVVVESTTSTNDSILNRATENTPEGLVVLAEEQTAGRGQRGNRWESAAGKGLWFSILLRPKLNLSQSAKLTIWAAQSIGDVIKNEFALKPTIKSPNDVYLGGRKVAGVLVEMRAQLKAPHIAIVGIGINVNQSVQEFPGQLQAQAISLAMVVGRQLDRESFAIALLRHLDRSYDEVFR